MRRHQNLTYITNRAGLLAFIAEPEEFTCIVLASHVMECIDDHLPGPSQGFCVFLEPMILFRI